MYVTYWMRCRLRASCLSHTASAMPDEGERLTTANLASLSSPLGRTTPRTVHRPVSQSSINIRLDNCMCVVAARQLTPD